MSFHWDRKWCCCCGWECSPSWLTGPVSWQVEVTWCWWLQTWCCWGPGVWFLLSSALLCSESAPRSWLEMPGRWSLSEGSRASLLLAHFWCQRSPGQKKNKGNCCRPKDESITAGREMFIVCNTSNIDSFCQHCCLLNSLWAFSQITFPTVCF